MTEMKWIRQLLAMRACPEAIEWARAGGYKTLAEAWGKCERVDRMLWLLEEKNADRKLIARCACDCALKRISEKLDYTPGVFTVECHIRSKWTCA